MNDRLLRLIVINAIDDACALPKGGIGDFIEGFVWNKLLHELAGMHADLSVMIADNTLFVAIQWEPNTKFILHQFDIVPVETKPHEPDLRIVK
jgi:hypothetical protein